MAIQKNDFIEIEFTGKSNDQIFDTTNKEDAKQMGLDANVKPVIIAVGHKMLVEGFDDELPGKEIGKKYTIKITDPQKGFGKRNPALIKTVPLRVFREQNMNPMPGMTVQLDNNIAKILSVSGGRISVDFNNPLAGKEIDYEFTVKRKVDDKKEKVDALQDFFFRQKFEFEIKDNKVIFKEAKIKPIVEMMAPKLKEISGYDFEVSEGKNLKENIKEDIKEVIKKSIDTKNSKEKVESVKKD